MMSKNTRFLFIILLFYKASELFLKKPFKFEKLTLIFEAINTIALISVTLLILSVKQEARLEN